MNQTPEPTAARALLDLAIDNGWSVIWKSLRDTGGSPYVHVQIARDDDFAEAYWHTRETGTYRFNGGAIGRHLARREVPLRAIKSLILSTPAVASE